MYVEYGRLILTRGDGDGISEGGRSSVPDRTRLVGWVTPSIAKAVNAVSLPLARGGVISLCQGELPFYNIPP